MKIKNLKEEKPRMLNSLKIVMPAALRDRVESYSFHNRISKGELARKSLELYMKVNKGVERK